MTFGKGMKVGGAVLAPARYRIEHRVEDTDHIVRFQPLAMTPKGFSFLAGDSVDVRCRLEPLRRAAEETTLWIVDDAIASRLFGSSP